MTTCQHCGQQVSLGDQDCPLCGLAQPSVTDRLNNRAQDLNDKIKEREDRLREKGDQLQKKYDGEDQ